MPPKCITEVNVQLTAVMEREGWSRDREWTVAAATPGIFLTGDRHRDTAKSDRDFRGHRKGAPGVI
jgi:hypothetical protein